MLEKEFFNVKPFNPYPFWPGDFLVNLNGAQKYEQNTIFQPGRYQVLVQAGSAYSETFQTPYGISGKVLQTINIYEKFIIRAYCGSSGTSNSGGVNPYSGPFKVNPYHGNIAPVYHIFGNCGGSGKIAGSGDVQKYGSGNCLGNGALHMGAGSCLHIMPVGGTFGTNYLFAFHTTASVVADGALTAIGGGGSAYGGSASGSAYVLPLMQSSVTSYSGGSTPYGSGGLAVTQSGAGSTAGKNGTGIGHGFATTTTSSYGGYGVQGAAAWFNGTSWVESLARTVDTGEQGRIYVKYLGRL